MIHPRLVVSRRTLLATAAAAPAGLLAAGCDSGDTPQAAGADGPADEVTYLTNFGQFGRDAYSYLALEQGMFTDRNLAVSIEPGSGTNGNVAALLSGQAQFATVDLAGAVIARGQEPGFVVLAAVQQRTLAAVMTLASSGITEAPDLEGRSVGLPAGAITELLFPAYARLAGIDLESVEQVPVEPPALAGALASGQVDAIGQFVVGQPLVEAAAGGREVVVLPYNEFIDDLYGVGLCTTAELAESDPDLCVRFRDGLLAGLQAGLDDPAVAAEALAAHAPETDVEVAAGEMELMGPYARVDEPGRQLGDLDEARVMRMMGVMASLGEVGSALDPADPEALVAFDLTTRPDQ